jgi:adenylate cyclase
MKSSLYRQIEILLESNLSSIRKLIVYVVCFGLLYSVAEYYFGIWINDKREYIPLLIRVMAAAVFMGFSIAVFEGYLYMSFRKKPFLLIVILRSVSYSVIITLWLIIINGIWESVDNDISFRDGVVYYLRSEAYLVNLATLVVLFIVILGINQINSLHRKGELMKFILGRFHQPREIEQLFCFIDLNNSTTIAEKLGNLKFGSFLKDYYSDLTDAIRYSGAEIYLYVGDEIILTWPVTKRINYNKVLSCIFIMKQTIRAKENVYRERYGYIPEFKAGLHGGNVLVTWVGELKKEIIYLGDVLNTASRIQGECKRLGYDFLVSEYIKEMAHDTEYIIEFADELVPRGKESKVKIYRVLDAAAR